MFQLIQIKSDMNCIKKPNETIIVNKREYDINPNQDKCESRKE